jgi:hypothetical protein
VNSQAEAGFPIQYVFSVHYRHLQSALCRKSMAGTLDAQAAVRLAGQVELERSSARHRFNEIVWPEIQLAGCGYPFLFELGDDP